MRIDSPALEGFEAVVHLAGESITGRWTAAKSGAYATAEFRDTVAGRNPRWTQEAPKVLVSASATGYYGDRAQSCSTRSRPDRDFCRRCAGLGGGHCGGGRSGHPRGLSADWHGDRANGGSCADVNALQGGIGGVIGDGSQYWSWIALEDLNAAILRSSPTSRSQARRTPCLISGNQPSIHQDLGRVLSRPTIFALPELAVKVALGEWRKPCFSRAPASRRPG